MAKATPTDQAVKQLADAAYLAVDANDPTSAINWANVKDLLGPIVKNVLAVLLQQLLAKITVSSEKPE